MEPVACVLISILSIPFSNLLFFLASALLRLGPPVVVRHAGAPRFFAWPTDSHRFHHADLSVSHYVRNPSSDEASDDDDAAAAAAAVECVFCFSDVEEGDEIRELRCRHLFHRRCLDRWLLRRRATCPLCRDALVPPHEPAATKGGGDMVEEDEFELGESPMAVLFAYVWRCMW